MDTKEQRMWALEKAIAVTDTKQAPSDLIEDLLYRAGEIEAYIENGSNPKHDFKVSVDAALTEINYQGVPGVSADKVEKVVGVVKRWLEHYGVYEP